MHFYFLDESGSDSEGGESTSSSYSSLSDFVSEMQVSDLSPGNNSKRCCIVSLSMCMHDFVCIHMHGIFLFIKKILSNLGHLKYVFFFLHNFVVVSIFILCIYRLWSSNRKGKSHVVFRTGPKISVQSTFLSPITWCSFFRFR